MLPVVVPLVSFRIFTSVVLRERIPFSSMRVFSELSSLIEILVLSDEIRFFNVGAFTSEWQSGSIIPSTQMAYNPFEPFHGIDFICPLDYVGKEKRILQLVPQKEREHVFDEHFGKEPRSEFGLWTYLITYVQAYNGAFGEVAVKGYPLIRDLLPKIVVFNGSTFTVSRDSLVFKAYDLLKETYVEKLRGIVQHNVAPVAIPPVTAILLSRLPDNCVDPSLVVRELINLREELAAVRSHFSELEAQMYSNKTSLKDLENIEKAIRADAEMLGKRYSQPFSDNAFIRWFIDNASFLTKLLIKRDVEYDEVISVLARIIPNIRDRIGVVSPTLLFDFAVKARNIKGYRFLLERKLGLDLSDFSEA